MNGAENGVRTRDLQLGKLALYQLSYFRVFTRRISFNKRETLTQEASK